VLLAGARPQLSRTSAASSNGEPTLGETTPMHRVSQPEEIAEIVGFLASPRASYVTGTTVAADGGRRAI